MIDVAELMFDYLGYDWTLYLVPDGFYGGYDNCTDYNDVTGNVPSIPRSNCGRAYIKQ